MSDRPNFILYVTDQHRADYLGCYGHPVLKTPHIDRMAEAGVAFDKFYVASPVCMPNRASLMTCRMPSSHGVRMNGVPLDRRHVTFVELLREAGYRTALIGKSHLQCFTGMPPVHAPAADRTQAVRHDLGDGGYELEGPAHWAADGATTPTPFYGFDHVELVTGHGDHIGGDYAAWLAERCDDSESLIGAENQLPHDYSCPQAVRTRVPEELYSTTYIAERASAWIEAHKSDDQPFFLMVSWPDPHHPFNPPGRYWDMYSPDDMPEPQAFARGDWTPPPHVAGVISRRKAGAANLQGMNAVACSAREAQEAQALTCGMISMIDDAVGRVNDALDASGRAGDTVRVFTTDHGDHLGDHQMLFKGAEQYEQITRVPFIWSDPDGAGGAREDRVGQTHDIGTSILARAGAAAAVGMKGRDLFGGAPRDAAFIQYAHQQDMDGIGLPPHAHTIRRGRWRLTVTAECDWGELYDLDEDPGEVTNLWDDGDASAIKLRLMEALVREEMANADASPLPTGRA
ncbi:MAG: sulfatase-like hydrolase/transferase [Pseudomonadota bacterium]